MRKFIRFFTITVLILCLFVDSSNAATKKFTKEDTDRMSLYLKYEAITSVPWYYIAAVDQFEKSLRIARKDLPDSEGLTGVFYTPQQWVGPLNPNLEDTNPNTIALFGGIGKDGNMDGVASRSQDEDVLYTLATYLQSYGFDKENFKIALWDYYQRDKTVDIIMGNAKIYKEFSTVALNEHAFPVPLRFNYSYRSTWGDRRGWGGLRSHEGTDIFADHGVPVRATGYGIIEVVGWNQYGGWRVGIRDLNNVYHYFAHLRGYEKGIEKGMIVKPGQVIGYVGSSGYGPPGTSGKFPPHLHYGLYRDNGYTEWSFDPIYYLRAWEKQERNKR